MSKRTEESRGPIGVERSGRTSAKKPRRVTVENAEDVDSLQKLTTLHKRFQWSRALRDEAYGKFLATREGLRALYRQIDLEKDKLQAMRRGFAKWNSVVNKQRNALRDMCLTLNIPDDDAIWMEVDSSDYRHDTGSITEGSSEDDEFLKNDYKQSAVKRK